MQEADILDLDVEQHRHYRVEDELMVARPPRQVEINLVALMGLLAITSVLGTLVRLGLLSLFSFHGIKSYSL